MRMAKKVVVAIDSRDRDVMGWKIDGSRTTKNGYYIQDSVLGDFLDRECIAEIETAKAVDMWSAKYETPERLAKRTANNARDSKATQHFADMEKDN